MFSLYCLISIHMRVNGRKRYFLKEKNKTIKIITDNFVYEAHRAQLKLETFNWIFLCCFFFSFLSPLDIFIPLPAFSVRN